MKKTFALIIVLIMITAGLVIYALQTQPKPEPVHVPTQVVVKPTPTADTMLSLSPSEVQATASGSGSINVLINPGYNTVSSVQLELAYDPKVLTNVTVIPSTYFASPTILLNQNDTKTGRYSFAVNSTGIPPVQGEGVLAVISFKKAPAAASMMQTTIDILDKSLVSMEGVQNSVLKEVTGATVLLSPLGKLSAPVTK